MLSGGGGGGGKRAYRQKTVEFNAAQTDFSLTLLLVQ